MADTMLNIVDDNDEIIGQALRSEIHANGLLHREIHVWFITPDKQVIFQKRSMLKETIPGMLTPAVGGHVELGQDYLQTAITETLEETGLTVDPKEIVFLHKYKTNTHHPETKVHNRSFRVLFGMVFTQGLDALRIEAKDGEGFVAFPFDALTNPSEEVLKHMPYGLLEIEFPMIKQDLEGLVA